jgi:hypothetical protein
MILSATIMTAIGGWTVTRPCEQLDFIWGQNNTLRTNPECMSWYDGTNPDQKGIVEANMDGGPANVGAALGIPFGAAGWVAWWLHAIVIEVYVRLSSVYYAALQWR